MQMFMESENVNISEKEKFLDWASGQGPTAVAETAICQRFLLYLYRLVMSGEASCGIYITALKACTKQLSDCISRRNGPPIAKGTVRNLSSIPKATKEINEKKKCDGMSGVQDMQINAIEELSRDDLIKAMDKFYSHDGSLKLCPLMIFNTHVEFLLGITMLSRGEDTRFFTFGVMFTAMLVNIGFGVFSVLCYISSCGKTNDSGHYTKTGVAPHKNPILCSVAPQGFLLLYRFNFLKDPTPDFLDFNTLYSTPLLRSSANRMKATSYEEQYKNVNIFFEVIKIDPAARTHFGRGFGERLLDEIGVNINQIQRLASKVHDAQHNSYVTGLPRKAILGASGHDPEDPQNAFAAHLSVDISDDELFSMESLEWLRVQSDRVEAAITAAVLKGPGTMAKERLFTARGSLKAFIMIFKVSLRVAASRPRDVNGHIVAESDSIYLKYRKNPVFDLPLFKHRIFAEIAARVREAENRELEAASFGHRAHQTADVSVGLCSVMQKMDKKLDMIIEQQTSNRGVAVSCLKPSIHGHRCSQSAASSQSNDELIEPQVLSQGDRGGRRLTRAEHVDLSKHVYLIPLSHHQNVTELWREFNDGPNALRVVNEKSGGACFDYGSTKKRWSEQRFLYKFVEARMAQGMTETQAIAALQCELDKFPRTRKQKNGKPNWKALLRSVASMPESQEHKKRKRCSSSSSSSEIVSDSINIDLRRDGSVRETDACALPFDAFISVAPARAAGSLSMAVAGTAARSYTGFAL